MKIWKYMGAVAGMTLMLATACSDNNTDAAENQKDTNMIDTRRYSDTTHNFITGDSAGINQTPAQRGVGLDQ